MGLVRPRLIDHFDLPIVQEDVDFAIPYLDEDVPLCLDPFLLWKSPSLQDNALHTAVVNSFNNLGFLVQKGQRDEARAILIQASECEEVGLGFSATREGKRIGPKTASQILSLFDDIPQVKTCGFTHFEEIQLLVDNISKDRISDIACNFLMSFLVDFTIQQCQLHSIPTQDTVLPFLYEYRVNQFKEERVKLPVNPVTHKPVVLVPKRWLRAIPWINYDDYIQSYYLKEIAPGLAESSVNRLAVLDYNRHNYGVVQEYTKVREQIQEDCKTDPLFKQLSVFSVARKLGAARKLPTGKDDEADRKYEDLLSQAMPSMLYPHLDFADAQSRTESGVLIRDLVFYNGRNLPFLKDIYDDFGSRQIVMELKNVKAIEREHINQLNRYLSDHFGRFGVLVTRHPLTGAMFKNTIDLWAGQRRCIVTLTDEDLELMSRLFHTKQRLPIEVINKKYVEFLRACPS